MKKIYYWNFVNNKGRNTGSHSLFVTLATGEGTKQLQYYAPEDVEKVCPPKEARQRLLK